MKLIIAGATGELMKQKFGWKSEVMTKEYVSSSKSNQSHIAKILACGSGSNKKPKLDDDKENQEPLVKKVNIGGSKY